MDANNRFSGKKPNLANGPKSLDKALQKIDDGITFEVCGCESKIVVKDGVKGKSVTPCKGHTLEQIAGHQQQITNLFAHLAKLELQT